MRRWGLVTELAETLDTSRERLYTIAARLREGVLVRPTGRRPAEVKQPEPLTRPVYPSVIVTPNRVKRTVLTNLLPGGMTIRPQIESLQTALEAHRGEGWISELILETGLRAGRNWKRLAIRLRMNSVFNSIILIGRRR